MITTKEDLFALSKCAFDFLASFNGDDYVDGRYELDENIYFNIETYYTKYRAERRFEAHKKYIDVQYMISGREIITVCSVDELKIDEDYNDEKDISFFKNSLKGIDVLLEEGNVVILFPNEAHMPCICVNQREKIRKLVIKIPI